MGKTCIIVFIGEFRGVAEGAAFSCIFTMFYDFALKIKSFCNMLFHSIFRNVNVTFLCITNTLTMLYAACPEK